MPMVMPVQKFENPSYVSAVCRESKDPIFISENGSENMVLMSMDQYRKTLSRIEIYTRIEEAEAAIAEGDEMDAYEHLNTLGSSVHAVPLRRTGGHHSHHSIFPRTTGLREYPS